jgi:hypothetical protein
MKMKLALIDTSSQRVVATKSDAVVTETKREGATMDQKLANFVPAKHGGELMAFPPVGKEILYSRPTSKST